MMQENILQKQMKKGKRKGERNISPFFMKMKRFYRYIFLLCILCACNQQQVQVQQKQILFTPKDGFGIYEYCAPRIGQLCFNRLKQIHSLGFKIVINYQIFSGSTEQILQYAEIAKENNISLLYDFTNISTQLQHECTCTDIVPFILPFIKNLSNTYGYYIADEAPIKQHDQIKQIKNEIKQYDTLHPTVIVTLHSLLSSYSDIPDILAVDDYPIGVPNESIHDLTPISQDLSKIIQTKHIQAGAVLQAHSLAEYPNLYDECKVNNQVSFIRCPYPNKEQMKEMLLQVEENVQTKFILWYSFFDVVKADNSEMQLDNLKQVIQ